MTDTNHKTNEGSELVPRIPIALGPMLRRTAQRQNSV